MMSTKCRIILTCMTSLVLALNSLAQTEKRCPHSSDTYHGLHLSINLDGTSYRLGEIATLQVTLKNTGDLPITIYKKLGWGCLGSLGYRLADSQGRGLMPTFLYGSFYSPPFPREDFITLRKGEVIQTQIDLDIGRREGIRKPGIYQVRVWYNNPVPQDFAPEGLQMWRMEEGDLVAKLARFTVTHRRRRGESVIRNLAARDGSSTLL